MKSTRACSLIQPWCAAWKALHKSWLCAWMAADALCVVTQEAQENCLYSSGGGTRESAHSSHLVLCDGERCRLSKERACWYFREEWVKSRSWNSRLLPTCLFPSLPIYHKIYHFSYFTGCDSVTFSTFPVLCNQHHCLGPEDFHPPRGKLCTLSSHSPSPLPQAPGNLLSLIYTLSLWICFFWIFHINSIVQQVPFVPGILHFAWHF